MVALKLRMVFRLSGLVSVLKKHLRPLRQFPISFQIHIHFFQLAYIGRGFVSWNGMRLLLHSRGK